MVPPRLVARFFAPSHVYRTGVHPLNAHGSRVRELLAEASSATSLNRDFIGKVWKNRSSLLPRDIATLLHQFVRLRFYDEQLCDSFARSLSSFSDLPSFFSSLISLKSVGHPTDQLEHELHSKLQADFSQYSFTDLRIVLLAFALVFQPREEIEFLAPPNHSVLPDPTSSKKFHDRKRSANQRWIRDRDPRFPAIISFHATKDNAVQFQTASFVGTSVTPSKSIIRRFVNGLEIRIKESLTQVTTARLPWTIETNKRVRMRYRRRRATESTLRKGLIGIDSREFLALPYILARLQCPHNFILEQSCTRIAALARSRMPADLCEILTAIEGFARFRQRCQDKPAKEGDAKWWAHILKRQNLFPVETPPAPSEAEVAFYEANVTYAKMITLCSDYTIHLMDASNVTISHLNKLYQQMISRNFLCRETWAVWARACTDYALPALAESNEDVHSVYSFLKTLLPVQRWLRGDTRTILYLMAIAEQRDLAEYKTSYIWGNSQTNSPQPIDVQFDEELWKG